MEFTVSQLQNLETTLSSVLMEAALKLAGLTDASIFFLVETAEGKNSYKICFTSPYV
jgi:hypothetical protein